MLVAAIFHSAPPFPRTLCLLSFLVSHPRGLFGRRPSEPTPVFALYNLDTFPIRPLLALAGLPPISSTPHFSKALSSMFCTLSHCQCFAHSFLFASQRSNGRASASSIFKICARLLHAAGLQILCKSPALPSHLRHFLLMHCLHIFLLVLLLYLLQPLIPFLHGVFLSWMDPRFLAVCRQQLSDPPSVFGINPSC